MKKRFLIALIIGFAFTPSAYAKFSVTGSYCPPGEYFDADYGGCVADEYSNQRDEGAPCPAVAALEAKALSGSDVDGNTGGGGGRSGIAGR